MEITSGPLGFKIPVQSLKVGKMMNFTPSEVINWRNSLAMADLSATTKKLYYTLMESNEVQIPTKERLEILELLRPTVQFICQSLSKHYINQPHALTKAQFIVANLSQSLQCEMTYGYKIIIEQSAAAGASPELKSAVLPLALQRLIYYFGQILIRSYKIYSNPPIDLWRELHLVYSYIHTNLPQRPDLIEEYKRILLLASSHPLQWRQSEQDAVYKGTEIWSPLAILSTKLQTDNSTSYLVIDIHSDQPPIGLSRGSVKVTDDCRILEVHSISDRLKNLVTTIEPNEFKSRASHYNQVEYTIPLSVIKGLIKLWDISIPRTQERIEKTIPVEICIGLRATHFYVNHQNIFEIPNSATNTTNPSSNGNDNTWVQEVNNSDALSTTIDFSVINIQAQQETADQYKRYPAKIVNESSMGYAIVLSEELSTNTQSGELIGLQRSDTPTETIEICAVRWIQYTPEHALHLGLERLSNQPKPGAIQLLEDKTPVGDYMRCLILESSVLVPTLPFKNHDHVNLIESPTSNPQEYELKELLGITGGYKQFQLVQQKVKKEKEKKKESSELTNDTQNSAQKPLHTPDTTEKKEDPFDNIWSQL